MSNCYNCKKKFTLFNVDRRRCKECEQYFCYNCTPHLLSNFCRICKILNTRPAVHSMIVKLRSRELKLYLARRKIQTESCIEKEDLIRCFFKYVSLEPQLKNKNIRINTIWSTSTPNLHTNQNRYRSGASQSQTPPARAPHPSTHDPGMGSSSSEQTHSRESFTQNGDSHTNQATNLNPSAPPDDSPEINSSDRARIKLSELTQIEDIQNLSIKQLKDILVVNRVDFKGCVEKDELIGKVEQLWKASVSGPDVSALSHGDLCKICMDAPLNSVLLECGHIVSCINCGKQLSECPICRQYVVRVVHTFKA